MTFASYTEHKTRPCHCVNGLAFALLGFRRELTVSGDCNSRSSDWGSCVEVTIAFRSSDRVASAHDRERILSLSCGAVAMAIVVRSIHYIGMLAFSLPVSVK